MSTPGASTLNILIPIYANFNTLDVNGPLDVLCNYALRANKANTTPFVATITAKDSDPANSRAYEYISIAADTTFDKIIPRIKAGEFDILLIPGCGPGATEPAEKIDSPNILDVIKTFLSYDNKKGGQKWLVSICTGALLAGAAGAFGGLDATSHWSSLPNLTAACKPPAKSVTRKRWVDGGSQPPSSGQKVPTRILSSGGISCGLDACLYLIQQILGTQKAVDVAAMMDYHWNGGVEAVFKPSPPFDGYEADTFGQGSISAQWTTQQPLS